MAALTHSVVISSALLIASGSCDRTDELQPCANEHGIEERANKAIRCGDVRIGFCGGHSVIFYLYLLLSEAVAGSPLSDNAPRTRARVWQGYCTETGSHFVALLSEQVCGAVVTYGKMRGGPQSQSHDAPWRPIARLFRGFCRFFGKRSFSADFGCRNGTAPAKRT